MDCTCVPPSIGTGSAATAICVLDECTFSCHSCEHDACTAVEQECHDPPIAASDFDSLVLFDWWCACLPPAVGWAEAATAACWIDECHADCATCAATNCTGASDGCVDPDMANSARGDWQCTPPTFRLLKDGYLCSGDRRELDDAETPEACARLCEMSLGCRHFVYNKYDERCFHELDSYTLERNVDSSEQRSSGWAIPGFVSYRMTAEEAVCPEGSWGLLEADHAEMSSGPPPPCGAPYPRCFDDKVPSSPSECYETCYTNNETNPSLVFQ